MGSRSAPRNDLAAIYDANAAAGLNHLRADNTLRARLRNITGDALDDLDMGSITADLMFRLGVTYWDLGLTFDQAVALGFEAIEDDEFHHAILTDCWQRALRAAAKQTKAVA
jgi:hypothetical protein